MTDNKVGYKKPPKEYQIGQPLGPKPGITKETRAKQISNAIKVTEIREKMLDAILAKMGNDPDNVDEVLSMIDAHVNKLLLDTENRALGTAPNSVDVTSNGETVSTPTAINVVGVSPQDEPNDD